MDRSSIVRWVLTAMILVGGYMFFFGRSTGESSQRLPPETYVSAPGFAPDLIDVVAGAPAPSAPAAGETCTIRGHRFEADLSTRGAGLTHFRLTDGRYSHKDGAGNDSADMSTTPDIERWRNLRTLFRAPGLPPAGDDQVRYDRFDWDLERVAGGCEFSYADDVVRIAKKVSPGERPFELNVETTLTNLSDVPRRHATSVEIFAYRTNEQVKGKWGRVAPFQTNLECARGGDVKRLGKDASEFKNDWFSEPLVDRYAAITNYYFAQALVPLEAAAGADGAKPSCDLLSEHWFGEGQKPDDDKAGDVYKARLSYPSRTLAPNETATYRQIAFFGPKERDILADAGGKWPGLGNLIDLGRFSFVAKFLVTVITWIHAHVTGGSWGLAIIVLTVLVRVVLFPLTWKQIQSTLAMRRLKPEIDLLNIRFKDDAQAKNLAMMELWRKHKVNPLGGCVPALVQMPIWFALYATLQTAVEFYNTRFLWFSDLSAPDKYFILPVVLGATMIIQQRLIPQQGMDPMQQKMMMWMMPGIFTFMMLFLPAALGVYMLTNSALGISQQLALEKFAPAPKAPVENADRAVRGSGQHRKGNEPATTGSSRKGNARV
jgi:YidC/Oxa1 family membrane protein insertase